MKTAWLPLALKVSPKEQQERKGSSASWLWIVFFLHLLIPVLHFSGFILLACLHHCCIGIKNILYQKGCTACPLPPQPHSTAKCVCRQSLGLPWGAVAAQLCAGSVVRCRSPQASLQLCWGNVPVSLPAPGSCTEPGKSGMMHRMPFSCLLCEWDRFHLCFNK